MIIFKYLWIIGIIIFEFITWSYGIDSFKNDYKFYSCSDDKKVKRFFETLKYNIGLSITLIIHFIIIFAFSFIYWLYCLGVIG